MLADHIEATTAMDTVIWLAVVALWLAGVALVIYHKLRTSR